jgi:two-component system sensor histidine kinase ResE
LLLLANAELSKEEKKWVESAFNGSQDSISLINKIRYLREVHQYQTIQSLDVFPILDIAVKKFSRIANKAGKKIISKYDKIPTNIQGNELLEEVFSNLIENFIKHSAGNILLITTNEEDDFLRVIFEDDGEGVPKEILNNLFSRGTKGNTSGGSGLGLFLVRKILEGIYGKITYSRSSYGGAKFSVQLKKS